MMNRRMLLASIFSTWTVPAWSATWADRLVAAAMTQIGVTVTYDPSYVKLDYPGGDVAMDRGVCTDVIVRAYRAGLGIDLQKLVHEDMRTHFSGYPKTWGLTRPDSNIDHRRVPNLQTFFRRQGAALPVSGNAADYVAGDVVSMMLPGNLPHIAIVGNPLNGTQARPMLIHNIGAGAQLQDVLFAYPVTGHYRFRGA